MSELCVLVRYPDGSECFELLADYQRNPSPGSYIVHERPKVEPVKCEARGHQIPHDITERVLDAMRRKSRFRSAAEWDRYWKARGL
jgi:hypothetical protein